MGQNHLFRHPMDLDLTQFLETHGLIALVKSHNRRRLQLNYVIYHFITASIKLFQAGMQ